MKSNLSKLKVGILAALALAAGVSAPAQTAAPVKAKDFDAFKIITDRNIFDVNRRPHTTRYTPPPAIVDSFALTGTLSYESGSFAIFDGSSSDYHKALGVGGKIAGYSIKEVTHDSVTLASGTNELELKVGMQMRRGEDGKWSAGEAGGNSFASNSGSRFGNGGRLERGDRSERRNGFRTGVRNPGGGNASAMAGQPGAVAAEGNPTEPASTDPNDVVARMAAARNRELGIGGNQNQNDGGPANGDPNRPGGNFDQNANGPGENTAGGPNPINEPPPGNPGGNP